MRLIDTHAHLSSMELAKNLTDVLVNAKKLGVEYIINIASDPKSIEVVCAQSAENKNLFCTLGIQPHDAHDLTPELGIKIQHLLQTHPKVIGVGEIGLDGFHKLSPMEKQLECFEYFLNIAVKEKLPVVVHMRDTHTDVLSALKKYTPQGLTGVIHCFTGNIEQAIQYLDLGFYLSFSGIVTFKNSIELQEVAKFVPENRLVVETDCPYLAPVPLRGKLNEPANVVHTLEFIANIRRMDKEKLAELTWNNTLNLFPKLKLKLQ